MFKQLTRRPWVCTSCLRQQRNRRKLVGFAAAATREDTPTINPASFGVDETKDDSILRKIFDSRPFWKDFATRSGHAATGQRAGLLQNRYLTSPAGFQKFSHDALQKCRRIVSKVLAAQSVDDYRSLTRDLDRLSDQLCRVIDLVDFIRNVHPDPRVQHAATQAHSLMYEYMNVLNTTKGLNDQLQKAVSMPEVTSSWTEEETVTARILLKDFAHSAIAGPEADRERFVQLSNEVVQIGAEMLEKMAPEKFELKFSSSKLKGMDPIAVKKLTRWGTTSIPTHGRYAELALKTVEDPEVRREIYTANRTASKGSIDRVEHLLKSRAELARLSGHESFAHMTLSDKMAKTPEAVNQFLEALATDNKTHTTNDLSDLLDLKRADARATDFPNQINAWDRAYYTRLLRSNLNAHSRPSDLLSAYFSLGTVMQGLSRLFSRLYGIRLVPRSPLPGETWNDDVRRLDVIDETLGHIAVIYCDLFQRPNKSPNPAHFTLRCSREIGASEIAEAGPSLLSSPTLTDLSAALNDGMALNRDPATGTLHQLPTIAFICDFPAPAPSSAQPTLLTFRQLSTLFHEMGHALHSILGRTTLQNVAGTRCATDFAELPSILMEYFAAAPEVLGLFARHWETDRPLDVGLVTRELEANRRFLANQETEAQILFSVLDQRYHSSAVPSFSSSTGAQDGGANGHSKAWSSTAVYHSTFTSPLFSSIPEPEGTSWQGFFGHLFGYGAVYYSYLFDRAIAGRVWADVFRDTDKSRGWLSRGVGGGPLDRRNGQRYRDEVLKWGGGRDGWRCVAGVLGEGREWMAEGGEGAMKEVGRWGVGERGGAGAPM